MGGTGTVGRGGGQDAIELSLVIPAYNEERRIIGTLDAVTAYLARQPYASEIIVVDDGSTDATALAAGRGLASFPNGRVVSGRANRGKGYTVREGVLLARGEFVLFSDADLSTPIEEVERFLPLARDGNDVVIGSRALPGADIQVRQIAVRELMGKVFNLFVRVLVLRGIPDTQCGFKLFRGSVAREIFPRVETEGFGFDVEVLARCRAHGCRIAQVPVIWRDARGSKVRMLGSSLDMFVDLWRIRRRTRSPRP
jgi:dolichyl-phosphate beta-glucosyltransferase